MTFVPGCSYGDWRFRGTPAPDKDNFRFEVNWKFTPNDKCTCDEYGYIQIVKVIDSKGKTLDTRAECGSDDRERLDNRPKGAREMRMVWLQ